MFILGVCFNTDASACLMKNGKILSAISEERLNRTKSWFGIPHKSIKAVLDMNKLRIEDIGLIATHGKTGNGINKIRYEEIMTNIKNSNLSKNEKNKQISALKQRKIREQTVYDERIPDYLKELKKYKKPLKVYSHHECHAASAYFSFKKKNGYILTMDGWGEDGLSSTLWKVSNYKLRKISETGLLDSLGYFYGSITKSLGFIPHRHEGKVLGLAAFGNKNNILSKIEAISSINKKELKFVCHMEKGIYKPQFHNNELSRYIKKYSSKNVAFSAQFTLEKNVCKFIENLSGNDLNIFLAGGIFANVKLNQKIKNLKNVSNVLVFPNMGDGGLCVGASQLAFLESTKKNPSKLNNMLLGNKIDTKSLKKVLLKKKIKFQECKNIHKEIAILLSQNEIVIRVTGKMEFGPRALGNRSILYNCSDQSVNKWLNKKLNRTEFMPFAPATLDEDSHRMYKNMKGGNDAADFMTMTFDCSREMMKQSPAAVHVDGTARPQIISKKKYPDFYKILTEYKKITKKCSLINTSFNMHEEPIVSSIDDSLRAFRSSGLTWMAVENFLISSKEK